MEKRIYLVLETEADEDDKSIRSDIEQELGMSLQSIHAHTLFGSPSRRSDTWQRQK